MKTRSLTFALMLAATGPALAQPGAEPVPPQPQPEPQPQPAAAPPANPAARPGICITIDPARDTLTDQERGPARTIALLAFEAEGLATDHSNTQCSETYGLSNIKLGNTINVTLVGPRGQRQGRATSLDDLPNVYSQMVKSLVTGAPMHTGSGVTDRTNVTRDQSAPRRVAADNLKYLTLGYGGITARGNAATGPAFAVGYRKELDRIALDIAMTFLLGKDTDVNDGVTLAIPRLMALWNQSPTKDSTFYYGAGVSYGFSWIGKGDFGGAPDYTGNGMQLNAAAGYAAFRSSTIRLFLQLDSTFPLYRSSASATDTGWSPSAMFTLGIGWGKTTQVVRVINE